MIACYINNILYDAEFDFQISEQAGNKSITTINVYVADSSTQPIPVAGDIIQLVDTDTNTILFWGVCSIPKSPKINTGLEPQIYTISCTSANAILANRLINEAFQGYTMTEIITTLYNSYIAAEGISLGEISDIPVVVDVYTAADYNLQDALNELADLVGATWRIDVNRNFYFVAQEDFPVLQNTIDTNFLLGTGYQAKTTEYKMRTVQHITGGQEQTLLQTESYTYDGEAQTFVTLFPIALQPTILVNNVQVPSDLIGVNGLSDNDQSVVFRWSYNSTTVNYVTTSNYLKANDVVSFQYIGLFPNRVTLYNAPKISAVAAKTGTSGLRESVQIVSGVRTRAADIQLAQSLLQQFESATSEVSFWLLSEQLYALGLALDDLQILTQVTINLPQIGISGTYVITERKIELTSASITSLSNQLKISLVLKSRNYLKSYGEILSDLRRDINMLSIRDTEEIIKPYALIDTEALTEALITECVTAYYPTTINSSYIFAPLPLSTDIYPE